MAKVYKHDFAKSLEKRKEAERKKEDTQEQIAYFMKYFGDQPKEVITQILDTMNTGDLEEFKRISEPIVTQKLIREYNSN